MPPILSLRRYAQTPIAHRHDHAQLVFGLDGQLEFEMDGKDSLITRYRLAVIPQGADHGCRSKGGSYCLVLDLAEGEAASQPLLQRADTLSLAPAQQQLVDWLAHSPLQHKPLAAQGAALLLTSLHTGWQRQGQRLPLSRLDAQIARHLAHPLQVADLARFAGLSCARLHALFVDETGQTPMDYVRRHRLQAALDLLRGTSLAVGEIAARVGYQSQSAFTAALRRECGRSARELRSEWSREFEDKTRQKRNR